MSIQWNTVTWYSKLLAVVVFIAVFVLGIYLGMGYQSAQDEARFAQERADLSAKSAVQQQPAATSSDAAPLLMLSAPANGTTLCRGATIQVGWTATSSIDQVLLSLDTPVPAQVFGQYPATHNETGAPGVGVVEWVVGASNMGSASYDLPDGDNYRISIKGISKGRTVTTISGGLFSIQTCRG